MDGYRDFTWDRTEFPDPEGLNHQLHDMGFRVVTIVDPGVKKDKTYGVCADGLAKDMFCTKDGKISRHEWMLADKFVVLQSRMISVEFASGKDV